MVKDIYPGSSSSYASNLTNVNGTLFFEANESTDGYELWKSDGTDAGTVMVKDICPGGGSSIAKQSDERGGTLFFTANDGTNGKELWKSDGTAAGTDARQGHQPRQRPVSHPRDLTTVGARCSSWPPTAPTAQELVEERRHGRRHRPGQGHRRRASQSRASRT